MVQVSNQPDGAPKYRAEKALTTSLKDKGNRFYFKLPKVK